MTTYESPIQSLHCQASVAYEQLTDLTKLEQFKSRIPDDKLKNAQFTSDSISVEVSPVGTITLRIIDKEPCKTIKFGADNSPIAFNMWIQLKELAADDTRMKITIKAEIPMMIKPMIGNKVDRFLEQLSNGIALALNKVD